MSGLSPPQHPRSGTGSIRLDCDPEAFAALEAIAFEKPWPACDFIRAAERRQASFWLQGRCVSFIYGRLVAGEAEVWRIATAPEHRGQGYAKQVLAAFLKGCREDKADSVFLEVASNNVNALGFYLQAGFVVTGRRADYYGPGDDALLLGMSLEKKTPSN